MNKKSYIVDLAYFGVFALILAIAIIVGSRIFSTYGEKYDNINTSSTAIGQRMMQDYNNRFNSLYDYVFLTIVVFFIIGLFISFSMIDSHPAYFFLILIVFIFLIIANAALSNVFETFTEGSFSAEAQGFPILGYLMENWVMIIVVVGFVALGLLFAKLQTGVFR